MLDHIISNPYEFWLLIGGIMLIAEVLGSGGYLLCSGIAAIILSILVWLIPFNGMFQGIMFLILITFTTFIWWYLFNKNKISGSKYKMLNKRAQQMIGTQAILIAPTNNGYSRVKIADGSWRIYCNTELNSGTKVKIISINGNTLNVKPIIN